METPPEPADRRGAAIDDAWWPKEVPAPFRHTIGVRQLPQEGWLAPQPHDGPWLAWRRRLLDAAGEAAFAALPGSEAGGAEVLEAIRQVTGETGDDAGGTGHPLDTAGRLVVEDLLLLDVAGPAPVLVAGSLAMPNRWLLHEKLGRDLFAVHTPVPGFNEQIGPATDRLLLRLAEGRVMSRSNIAVNDRPELWQPASSSYLTEPRIDVASARDAAEKLHLRVEYQTLRAFPSSRTVLFTIRTAVERLGALADRPAGLRVVAGALDHLPADHLEYKGAAPYLTPMRAWLADALAAH